MVLLTRCVFDSLVWSRGLFENKHEPDYDAGSHVVVQCRGERCFPGAGSQSSWAWWVLMAVCAATLLTYQSVRSVRSASIRRRCVTAMLSGAIDPKTPLMTQKGHVDFATRAERNPRRLLVNLTVMHGRSFEAVLFSLGP